MKVLDTVGEAVASERDRPVEERPKVRGSEVVCRVSLGLVASLGRVSPGVGVVAEDGDGAE